MRGGEGEPEPSAGTASTDPVLAYLNGIADKNDATCEETPGAVHTYKEEVPGTYTITGPDWTLNIPDLPTHNQYGNPYTYYVVEEPITGYDVSYTGQDDGLTSEHGSATVTNTQKTIDLSVNKEWVFSDPSRVTIVEGKDWPLDTTVHVVVYSRTGEDEPTPTTYSVDLTAEQQSYTFTGLPEYAGENKIEYVVVEAGVTGVNGTYFTSAISGDAESGYTITNTEKPTTTDFSFMKLWRDALGETILPWPSGESITVTIRQDAVDFAQYTISAADLRPNAEISADGDGSADKPKLIVTAADGATGYVFTLHRLPDGDPDNGYTYTVVEAKVDGYQTPKYYEPGSDTSSPAAQQAGNGGVICNDMTSYVLPQTGGTGTLPYTLGGLALMLAASILLLLRRKRQKV